MQGLFLGDTHYNQVLNENLIILTILVTQLQGKISQWQQASVYLVQLDYLCLQAWSEVPRALTWPVTPLLSLREPRRGVRITAKSLGRNIKLFTVP